MNDNNDQLKKRHPITEISIELGNLAYQCRKAGFSFRLLAALMNTKSFGVVYQSMISAAKGRGGERGPTRHDDIKYLEMHAKHLLIAMEARKITPRRWCTAYDVDLNALFAPGEFEINTDIPLLDFLKEDFPEAYGLIKEPYVHAYQDVQGFEHITNRKKGIHIYKTNGQTVVSKSNGKALGIACTLTGLTYQKDRLAELLKNGPEAALAWLPGRERILPLRSEQEREQAEFMKRQSVIDDVISVLAALPRHQYASGNQIKQEELLYLQLEESGVSKDYINNTVKTIRLRTGRY